MASAATMSGSPRAVASKAEGYWPLMEPTIIRDLGGGRLANQDGHGVPCPYEVPSRTVGSARGG
jgi:hypothetical protein